MEQLYRDSFRLHFNSELTVAFRALQCARWTWPEQIELGELRDQAHERGHANLFTSQNRAKQMQSELVRTRKEAIVGTVPTNRHLSSQNVEG